MTIADALRSLFRRQLHEPVIHTAWCDSHVPLTKCNCDPKNPNSRSAYALMEAIEQFKQADREMQELIFGRKVLPDVDAGTAWEHGHDRR